MILPRLAFLALTWAAALANVSPSPDRAASLVPERVAQAAAPFQLAEWSLPNGFTVVEVPRPDMAEQLSLRLVVLAGSLDEQTGEEGYAHFVEHMAFNGTRNYPAGSMAPFFNKLGMRFGPEVNASTGLVQTCYKIDLPQGHTNDLPEALRVLGDYADGVLFLREEVQREKGVVLSEIAELSTAAFDLGVRKMGVLYGDTGALAKLPMGNPKSIKRANAEGLRSFYARCYRPGRMVLVVVGNFDRDVLSRRVADTFGALKGEGPSVPRVMPGALGVPKERFSVLNSPILVAAKTSFVVPSDRGDGSVAELRGRLLGRVASVALQQRMDAIQRANNEIIGAVDCFSHDEIDGLFHAWGVSLDTQADRWADGVALVQREFLLLRRDGFSEAELREAVTEVLQAVRGAAAAQIASNCAQLADAIAQSRANSVPWVSPERLRHVAEEYLPGLGVAELSNFLVAQAPEELMHVILERKATVPGGRTALETACRSAADALAQAPAAEAKPEAPLVFHCPELGTPGTVIVRRTEPSLSLDLVGFSNGVRLNLRTAAAAPGRFRMVVRLGRGLVDIPRDASAMQLLGVAVLVRNDLAHNTRQELRRLLAREGVDASWAFENFDAKMTFEGPVTALPFVYRLIVAQMTECRPAPETFNDCIGLYAGVTGSFLASTSSMANFAIQRRLCGDDSRMILLPEVPTPIPDSLSQDRVFGWVQSRFLNGPLEIGLVGDIQVEQQVALAAATIGAMSKRAPDSVSDQERTTYLTTPCRELEQSSVGDKSASVRCFWPVRDPALVGHEHAIRLVIQVLENRLSDELRERDGKTYSPQGALNRLGFQPDMTFASVSMAFAPADARKLAGKALAIATRLGEKGMSQAELDRFIGPLRNAAMAQQTSDDWWLDILARAQSAPVLVDSALTHVSGYDSLTLEEVNRVAALLLSGSNGNFIGVLPGKAN